MTRSIALRHLHASPSSEQGDLSRILTLTTQTTYLIFIMFRMVYALVYPSYDVIRCCITLMFRYRPIKCIAGMYVSGKRFSSEDSGNWDIEFIWDCFEER